jgi:hypothetical protein
MQRTVICAVAAIMMLPALAESPEPDRPAIVRAAQSCTAEGAFGHRFGEKNAGPKSGTGVPPFAIETLSSTAREDAVFEITAVASFAKALMSGEDRIALANWFFRALDTEAAAERRFPKRDVRQDGVTFHSNADVTTGYTLDISHDGTSVWIACTDVALKRRAWSEMRERRDEDH